MVRTIIYLSNYIFMRKRIVYAVFALMVISMTLSGCRSKELCPAYGDAATEQVQQDIA